jgi:hypothetical protein
MMLENLNGMFLRNISAVCGHLPVILCGPPPTAKPGFGSVGGIDQSRFGGVVGEANFHAVLMLGQAD